MICCHACFACIVRIGVVGKSGIVIVCEVGVIEIVIVISIVISIIINIMIIIWLYIL